MLVGDRGEDEMGEKEKGNKVIIAKLIRYLFILSFSFSSFPPSFLPSFLPPRRPPDLLLLLFWAYDEQMEGRKAKKGWQDSKR